MTDNYDSAKLESHGREIKIEASQNEDRYGQFCIRVLVDGKERWHAWYNDKSESKGDDGLSNHAAN